MKIGYARVSTQDQSLDLQMDALQKFGCEKVYSEKVSGMKDDRQKLLELIEYAREGDILVVYKLDRLGRSTKKLIELTEELERRGIELVSIRDSIDTTTAVGKAMFRMLAVLSEMERDLISERTRAGLESARARGRSGGRPKKDRKDIEKALKLYDTKQYTIKEIEEMTSVSKATLYRELRKRKSKKEIV
ncbi:recombinase family protein [Rossellomorea aquimaris]|uniref:Recombinase family protein n=1 Tax=Rossellomorea aquimaris TaxID=189382 RepID=A0A5D4U1N0_9BACI|nr:recombinase family protein [Rossellomorea aquimaris]TYS75916.1 recombinase family protein [Rossellomorea aquimaris]TYS81177.1 recombinase family protein [Rossellomorea aquimaris]